MSNAALPLGRGEEVRHVISARVLQRGVIWLTLFASCIAFIEPSPFEVMFTVMAFAFLVTRLRFSLMLAPLIVLLGLYNLGGLIALIPFTHDGKACCSS